MLFDVEERTQYIVKFNGVEVPLPREAEAGDPGFVRMFVPIRDKNHVIIGLSRFGDAKGEPVILYKEGKVEIEDRGNRPLPIGLSA